MSLVAPKPTGLLAFWWPWRRADRAAPSACASARFRSASDAAVSGFVDAARLAAALSAVVDMVAGADEAAGAAGAAAGAARAAAGAGAACAAEASALAAFSAAFSALLRLLADGSRGMSSRGPLDWRGVPAAARIMICIFRGTALSQLAFLNSIFSGRKQFSRMAPDTSFSRLRLARDRFGPLLLGYLFLAVMRARLDLAGWTFGRRGIK